MMASMMVFLATFVTVLLAMFLFFMQDPLLSGSLRMAYVGAYALIVIAAAVIAYMWSFVRLPARAKQTIAIAAHSVLGIYVVALLFRAVMLYRNYSAFIDLSYYESAVLQFSRFKLARIWDVGSPLWSQHFEPIVFLLVPWYWLGLGGSMLLVVAQAIAAIAGAVPLYKIVRHRLGAHPWVACAVVAAYLLFGGLQSSYFYGFHPITFFPFLFLSAVYWYERKSSLGYAVFLCLALCVKEEISFVVIAWGLWLLVGRKDMRWGSVTMAFGLIWYFISFGIISRFHNGGYEYWGQFGGGAGGGAFGIIQFALTHPLQFVGQFVNDERKVPTLIEMFGSFGFLPFVAPMTLIFLAPSLLLKLLSNDIAMLDSFHYSAEIAPLLALAAIEGIRSIRGNKRLMQLVPVYLGSVAICANVYYGFAFYYGTYALRLGLTPASDFMISEESKKLDMALVSIPKNATVSCQYQICSHIERGFWQKLPAPHGETLQYVIVDTKLPLVLTDKAAMKTYFDTKIVPRYSPVSMSDGIYLLRHN